jgi:hypothetical protein
VLLLAGRRQNLGDPKMFGTIKRMGLKRAAVLTTTVLVGMVGAVLLAGPASAHDFDVMNSTTQCDASTGTYTITYKGAGDYNLTSTVTVNSQTPSTSTVSPQTQNVAVVAKGGTYTDPFTLVQSGIPGTAKSASVTVTERWYDGYSLPKSSPTVALSGTCTKSASPSFTDNVCTDKYLPAGASYTIPSTPGVSYSVDHKVLKAGTYPATDGQTVVVYAHADNGYALSGPTSFTHTYGSTPTCTTTATATSPSFANNVCTDNYLHSGASYTIPATTGVVYKVNGITVPGPNSVNDGTRVTIIASAATGYTLTGTTSWTHEFGSAPTCTTTTEAVSPSFSDDVCTNYAPAGASYTIPATTGVVYKVNGSTVVAGTYPAVDGSTVVVTASPAAGYTLSGTTSFTHTFVAVPTCTTTAIVAGPKFTDDVCHTTTATGASYTVVAVTGVVYKVNGTTVAAGTYPAVDGSTVAITASPLAGYTLSGTTSFTHTYTAAPICAAASATLAFTGTSTSVPATVGIGAALLAVGGLLLAGAGRLGRRTN